MPNTAKPDSAARALADQLPRGFMYRLVRQPDGAARFLFVSAGVEEVLGIPPDRLAADAGLFLGAILPADRDGLEAARRHAIAQGGSLDHTFRLHDAAGRVVWVHCRARPRPGADGAVVWEGVILDVSHWKELEQELRQAQKMEAVGHLAGGVAHDFNNLLTIINGYSDVALASLETDHPARGLVEEVRKAGERAAGLTRQLLAFSRKQMLQPRVHDLGALVGDLVKMLHRMIGEDVELAIRSGGGPAWVRADPGQLEQVVMNLAVNARDAMPTGGVLTIEVRPAGPPDLAAAGLPAAGPYVLLAVSDTGTGMDEATRARIFEPFFTTKQQGKGTGLGLATVYGIVKQSGGEIAVASEPGKGTTFRVVLPAFDAPAATDGRPPEGPAAPAAGETVLLVEDDEEVRMLALRTLQDAGFVVLDAANGESALRVATAYGVAIRLLVTDVVMPGMSGRELADRLLAAQPELRVLYVSGYTDDAVMRHGIESDRVHFLPKPYSPADLAARVRGVLAGG